MENNRRKDNNRRKPVLDIGDIVFGKIPPQAQDLEKAVLGAILLERNAMVEVSLFLRPEHFYSEANQRIYKACKQLENKRMPIDMLTVVEQLRSNEELDLVGGPYYISQVTKDVVSSANIDAHCRIIIQKYISRELIKVSGETIGAAYEDSTDALQLLSKASDTFYQINHEIENTKTVELSSIAMRYIQRRENSNADPTSLLFTGYKAWDEINGPLFRGGIYVLAARPGMGKTVFIVELIKRMATRMQIGFINLEMSNDQIVQRFISNFERVDNKLFKRSDDDQYLKDRINRGTEQFINLKLCLESRKGLTIDEVCAKLRYWKFKFNIQAAAIDYLQEIGVSEERERYHTKLENTEYILKRLSNTAADLDIPLFLVCQLNRDLYKRGGNNEPVPSDLKDAGKIEEIAYQISFIHRPEFYGTLVDENGESTHQLAYQLIKKHRDGELARLKYVFEGQYSSFQDRIEEKIEAPNNFGSSEADDLPF